MFKNKVECSFQCNESEDLRHILTHCFPVISQTTASQQILNLDDIFGNVDQQKQVIQQFLKIDIKRQEMKDKLSPGGDAARTQRDS